MKIPNQYQKYGLRDVYNTLRGQTVKISLNVEIMPIVGHIRREKFYELNYTLPSEYK